VKFFFEASALIVCCSAEPASEDDEPQTAGDDDQQDDRCDNVANDYHSACSKVKYLFRCRADGAIHFFFSARTRARFFIISERCSLDIPFRADDLLMAVEKALT